MTTAAPAELLLLLIAACASAPVRELPRAEPRDAAAIAPDAPHIPADAAPDAARGRIVVTTSDECGLVLDMIFFPAGSAVPSSPQTTVLDQTAEMLRCLQRTEPGLHWEVQGHADPYEADAVALSDARARYARDQLVKRGVLPASLDAVGYGATLLLDRANSDFAHAKNRRVMFIRR
jgi:outer membrane protein OmpA-like peptidoglycan-associated protein